MKRALLFTLTLALFAGCTETEEPIDDAPPVPKASILFVNALLGSPPVQFQVQRTSGTPLASILPQFISFSGVSRYQRVEAGESEIRGLDSITREFLLRQKVTLLEDASYSYYLHTEASGDTTGYLLRDNLTPDSSRRAMARPVHLLAGADGLRYQLSRGTDTLVINDVPFAAAPPDFQPLFDTTGSILVTLRVDILENGVPQNLLFTGEIALTHGSFYSIVAIGSLTEPQIIVIPHSNL